MSSLQNSAVLLALGISFSSSADQPWQEDAQTTSVPTVACTVRLNEYNDGAPIDERFRNTQYADQTKYSSFTHSGITYTQHAELDNTLPKTMELSYQAESGLHNWYMPDETYYKSDSWASDMEDENGYSKPISFALSALGTQATLYDSRYTNWTESAEVSITDAATCLTIREHLEQTDLPEFYAFGRNSNDFAKEVWAQTGLSSDFEILEKTHGVDIIDRAARIENDLESGQLKDNYEDLPPPWNPSP